ncbi:MAG: helix-turn-helix domain-containing protein, partial [Gemmatimonadetes bacterium]|nr:helix-turn-helix domain-containing protein [Gemmatimonadota bacterium]
MSPDLQWRAVLGRDARFDGAFVYGVRSTRIYCRPSCPSRRPAMRHVIYFDRPADAERSGFRACLRCRPREARLLDAEVTAVTRACRMIERSKSGVTLTVLGKAAGMSSSRLRRAFSRVVGVSPKTYAEAWRMDQLKSLLKNGESITGALYGAGYGSPSRLYGKSSRRLGMTPGEYRNGAPAVRIRVTVVRTSLGEMLVAATERGICAVKLGEDGDALLKELKEEFDAAAIERDDESLAEYAL